MVITKKLSLCSRILSDSERRRSIVSRVIRNGEVISLMVSVIAIVVAEFLEKSPMKILKSVFLIVSVRMLDFANEPVSVEGVKIILSSGGSLSLITSGRTMRRFSRG